MIEREPKMPYSVRRGTPRQYWVGKSYGAVVSDTPVIRGKLAVPETPEKLRDFLQDVAAEAACDWVHYGGFLVCESCPPDVARRIAAALNFTEGVSIDFLEKNRLTRLLYGSGEAEE